VRSNDIDPLCKLISGETDLRKQHYRFCVVVSRSSYFRDKIKYPRRKAHPCHEEYVSFRTAEGVIAAAGKSFHERLMPCQFTPIDSEEESFLFISRAYMSNQVFVYRRDLGNGKIYLENLSSNVSIVDELNSFDFVED